MKEDTLQPAQEFSGEEFPVKSMNRMAPQQVKTREQELSLEYALPGLWNLQSDKNGIILDLRSFMVEPRFTYGAYPGHADSAYLVATLPQKPAELDLSGRAALYCDNTFIGYLWIDPDEADQEYVISFGTEKQILVSKKSVKVNTSSKRFPGQNTVSYAYEICIRNQKQSAVEVEVTDQVPISQDRAIRVDMTELSGGESDLASGTVCWYLSLGPGETKTLKLGYDVYFPKRESIQQQRF